MSSTPQACSARSLTFSPRMPWVGAGRILCRRLVQIQPRCLPSALKRDLGKGAGWQGESGRLQVRHQPPSGPLLQPTHPTAHKVGVEP